MDSLLELIQQNAKLTNSELAERLDQDEEAVALRIEEMEREKVILGYHGVIDRDKAGNHSVAALIEVKLTPERDGGFDHLAERVAKFDQVVSCYLMSGGYDLAVFVEGEDLREVARFVTEKLSTLDGVISTATHFQLKTYKQSGFLAASDIETERLAVTP
jgi:DNA-binding Lrp family transcriptional regulator